MSSPQDIEPISPLSPTSPDKRTLSGDTFTEKSQSNCQPPSEKLEEPLYPDIESQTSIPPPRRKSSLLPTLRSLTSTFSLNIPPHWKANHLNANRETRSLEDYPNGFPRFAAWMNCDENFLITRRYGWLHTRIMLFKQSELRELELELQRSDDEDAEDEDMPLTDHTVFGEGEEGEERRDLMKRIDEKLREYNDVVMRVRAMASLPKATVRNYTSVCNRLYNKGPISPRENQIFMNDSDFVALVREDEAKSLDGFIEDVLSMLPCRWLTRFLFSNAEQRATTNDEHTFLYDKRRIDTFIRLVITLLAVALLLAPVVLLFREQDSGTVKIMVILVFTLCFSLALSLATRARRAEVFAATAAYCAVLVVFLGNFVPASSATL